MDKKILISCPVGGTRSWILPYYLRNLYNLDYNKKLIDIYWILNNSYDDSLSLLQEYKQKFENEYNSITIEIYKDKKKFKDERKTNIRQQHTYPLLALLRNKILDKTVELDCSYLWSSDSDILFKPDTLNRLLSHNKNIVSCLLYNSYLFTPESPWKYTNILKDIGNRTYQHISNFKTKNHDKNPIGTLVSCDFTGASILISKEVCKVTRYADNKIYGEDEPWSFSARQAGYSLWCDISLYVQHVMSPDYLPQFKDFGV